MQPTYGLALGTSRLTGCHRPPLNGTNFNGSRNGMALHEKRSH